MFLTARFQISQMVFASKIQVLFHLFSAQSQHLNSRLLCRGNASVIYTSAEYWKTDALHLNKVLRRLLPGRKK
jgi:hypothetical protein